jgi:hypothetical protein
MSDNITLPNNIQRLGSQLRELERVCSQIQRVVSVLEPQPVPPPNAETVETGGQLESFYNRLGEFDQALNQLSYYARFLEEKLCPANRLESPSGSYAMNVGPQLQEKMYYASR